LWREIFRRLLAAANLAWAKPRRQNVDRGKKDRNWDREITERDAGPCHRHYKQGLPRNLAEMAGY